MANKMTPVKTIIIDIDVEEVLKQRQPFGEKVLCFDEGKSIEPLS